uniref:MD-2-related lipid-recognition domain-containing protein n=1 Tax=Davidia involucrata TaxID=16924 RepID=A0A5B6ZGZ0_DAVIN
MDIVVQLQFKLTLLFLFGACLLVPSIQAKDVKYCDKKGNYAVKVDGVEISPDPVVTGKPTTFSISASTGKAMSGGKLALEVSYFGIRVHTETHNLCKETSCPISVGKFVISHTQTLPGLTPPGSYTLKMKMEDENKHQLTCISFIFNIGFGSSVSSI